MKSIFGKLSILCFVILVVIFGIWLRNIFGETDPLGLCFAAIVLSTSTPIGFLFGYLSAYRQETPKCYRYIGFSLNFGLWLLGAMTLLILGVFFT